MAADDFAYYWERAAGATVPRYGGNVRKLKDIWQNFYYRRFLPYRLPTGDERIYFYHIRKTGGTSFGTMVMASCDERSRAPLSLWDALWAAHRHRLALGGKVFVAGEHKLLERGEYFFGTSHIPAHQLSLPAKTFTITCFRRPVDRIVSHYRMLLTQKARNPAAFAKEGRWLGGSFREFLSLIPKEHLMRQLYMFSESFDVAQAFDRIQGLSCWFLMEEMEKAARALPAWLGIELPEVPRVNTSEVRFVPSASEREMAEDILRPEMNLYDALLKAGAPAS